jgi:3-dehydroquinate synthase
MYEIYFETESFSELKRFLLNRRGANFYVLTDGNTYNFCLPILQNALSEFDFKVIRISAGEQYKNLDSCQFIWNELLKNKADKNSILVNLGGGVIGDIGGFCAACYKRGIDFIQIPTTLLSMVDASVGGKTGIDFGNIKNSVGIIIDPALVCIHEQFLKTLPEREKLSGFAEIIKHALIADEDYWYQLNQINTQSIHFEDLIKKSVSLKKSIVEKDPLEKGLRKILNFGHTIGHAIESLSWETEKPLLHGEAIAIGMICESYISTQVTGLDKKTFFEIFNFINFLYKPYNLEVLNRDKIFEYISQDKKNQLNSINFSLLRRIGQCEFNIQVEKNLIEDSLNWYQDNAVLPC